MKLTAPRNALVKLVTRSADVVDRKGPSFVASCVLIEARADDRVELRSTDNILALRSHGTAKVARAGALGVPAKELLDRLRALPEGDVDLDEDGTKLVVKQGRRRYTLKSTPASEFPAFPGTAVADAKPTGRFRLEASTLATLLGRTAYAMNADPTGKFHCTNLVVEGDTVRVDASDGHSFATIVEAGPSGTLKTALPHRTALVLRRLLESDLDDRVMVQRTIVGQVAIEASTWELVSPESPTPVQNIDKHLVEPPQHVTVGKVRLIEAIKGVQIASLDADLVSDGGALTVSAVGGDEAVDVLDVQGHEGALNVRCPCAGLLATLAVIDDAEVRIANENDQQPVYLRGESIPGLAGRFIVMPIFRGASK